jgi:predicted MFS family arabinose efflux permease
MSVYTQMRDDVMKVTGWSANTIGDLGGTIGGAFVAYYGAGAAPLISQIPLSGTIAACLWSALYWKRARRDNV